MTNKIQLTILKAMFDVFIFSSLTYQFS